MKSIQEIIPVLVECIRANRHDIGDIYTDGPLENILRYTLDGWDIEIRYYCDGIFKHYSDEWEDEWVPVEASGYVESIEAYYDGPDAPEQYFSDSDLKPLYAALDKELKDLT